jgi:hypothetical protein
MKSMYQPRRNRAAWCDRSDAGHWDDDQPSLAFVLAALLPMAEGERLYSNRKAEMPTHRNAWEVSHEWINSKRYSAAYSLCFKKLVYFDRTSRNLFFKVISAGLLLVASSQL